MSADFSPSAIMARADSYAAAQAARTVPDQADARSAQDLLANIAAILDRIAAEDSAWNRAPFHLRTFDTGHRALKLSRDGVPQVVALGDMTAVELAVV